MMTFNILAIAYFVLIAAAIVIGLWLAITAIRALNIYIRKNRLPGGDQQ